jgi:hypothetical protein
MAFRRSPVRSRPAPPRGYRLVPHGTAAVRAAATFPSKRQLPVGWTTSIAIGSLSWIPSESPVSISYVFISTYGPSANAAPTSVASRSDGERWLPLRWTFLVEYFKYVFTTCSTTFTVTFALRISDRAVQPDGFTLPGFRNVDHAQGAMIEEFERDTELGK